MANKNTLSSLEGLRDLSIVPGAVYLGPWADIDHEKFLIVAGVAEDRILVCSVMINSEINPYIRKRPRMLSCQVVPISELLPVAVDGVEDRWIYFDPVIAASIVFPGEEVPAHRTDYSHYMEAFERCFEGKKSYKKMVEKIQLMYVHEVQHWLKKHHQADYLKINESRL